jgi:hypothetical protein
MADVYIIGREAFSRVYAVLAFLSETERERERMRERERERMRENERERERERKREGLVLVFIDQGGCLFCCITCWRCRTHHWSMKGLQSLYSSMNTVKHLDHTVTLVL